MSGIDGDGRPVSSDEHLAVFPARSATAARIGGKVEQQHGEQGADIGGHSPDEARGGKSEDRIADLGPGGAAGHGGVPPHSNVSRLSTQSASRSRRRSEEHTSELQSLMRISYAVFCLKQKKDADNHASLTVDH